MSYSKYYLYKRQYSTDGGITWYDITPSEIVPSGDSIGTYETLEECEGNIQYRWVNLDPTVDYYCDLSTHAKYYKQQRQISYDGGTTWENVLPAVYQKGDFIELSVDCGYVPHTFNGKWLATYAGGTTSSAQCNSSSAITQNEIKLTNLVSVEIGNCVTNINNYSFRSCTSLTSIIIGNGLTSIGKQAFKGCTSLTSIDIPNSVTTIGSGMCSGCTSLTSCTIGSATTSIGDKTFAYCNSLTSVDVPNSVTSIGGSAFTHCTSLTSCTIGSGVTNIYHGAFNYCSSLTSIDIPDSVTNIATSAFTDCRNLTRIIVEATTPPSLGLYAFHNGNNCPIYVPSGSVNTYKAANRWSTYASRIQAIT